MSLQVLFIVFFSISNSIFNGITLGFVANNNETVTNSTELINKTTLSSTNKLKPTDINSSFIDHTNQSSIEFIGSNFENVNKSIHDLLASENFNKTALNFVDKSKLIVISNSTLEGAFGNNLTSTWSATLIIIILSAVSVIIVIVIISLFVMRRRFSKWRLDTNGNGGVQALTNEDCKNGDNISNTNDKFILKQDVNSQVDNVNNCGHENIVCQSTESIKIQNEINNAINDINANHETIETTKLLDSQQQQQITKAIEEVKKSTTELNDDIEKQPLNYD